MILENVINVLVAVGTISLAVVTFLSLRELKQQRFAGYMPHLGVMPNFKQSMVVGTNIDILVKNYGEGIAKNVLAVITDPQNTTLGTIQTDFLEKGESKSVFITYTHKSCKVKVSYTDLLDRKYPEITKDLDLP